MVAAHPLHRTGDDPGLHPALVEIRDPKYPHRGSRLSVHLGLPLQSQQRECANAQFERVDF
jgi:hypothetical protein